MCVRVCCVYVCMCVNMYVCMRVCVCMCVCGEWNAYRLIIPRGEEEGSPGMTRKSADFPCRVRAIQPLACYPVHGSGRRCEGRGRCSACRRNRS